MVSLHCNMEPTLENQQHNVDDLMGAATYFADDALAQCTDVSAMAFPAGHRLPTEQMLSAVATTIRNLVSGIENAIIQDNERVQGSVPVSWNMLLQSGFLREPALIDFALAIFAKGRLDDRILAHGETLLVDQMPAQLLVNSNPPVADAAKTLLSNETQMRRFPDLIHRQLSSELLHQTTWRIVAALQVISGVKNTEHIDNSKAFLTNHDASATLNASARKIAYFLHDDSDDLVSNPALSGTAIFVAALSARTGLDQDHVMRLADSHSSAPLALMLRSCGIPRPTAMAVICLFNGFDLTPMEISQIERYYDVLAISDAKASMTGWSAARTQQLTFPDMGKGGG